MGRLATEKNLSVLFQTMEQLPDYLKDAAQLIIVGDGPMRKEVDSFQQQSDLPTFILGFKEGNIWKCCTRSPRIRSSRNRCRSRWSKRVS